MFKCFSFHKLKGETGQETNGSFFRKKGVTKKKSEDKSFVRLYAFPILVAILMLILLNKYLANHFFKTGLMFTYIPFFKENLINYVHIKAIKKNLVLQMTDKDKETTDIAQEIEQKSEILKYKTKFTLQELVYKQEIDFIENLVKNSEFKKAINFLTKLATLLPNSPRIVYLSATIFDKLSEIEQSNSKLKKSIEIYKKIFQLDQVDKNILYEAGKRLINRLKFIGHPRDAVKYNELLVAKFPADLNLINELGVNYLIVNKPSLAKKQFNRILKSLDPNNSFALCHLAYILKQYERKINESIEIFKKCLTNNNQNVMDGKFFNQLGDALTRFNRTEEVLLKLIYLIKIKIF